MTSDKTFMNRFFADLAIHSPGQEIHYKLVQLEQTYHVPRIDIRQLLAQWAHQGFIQLNFCPRFLLQAPSIVHMSPFRSTRHRRLRTLAHMRAVNHPLASGLSCPIYAR